MRVVIDALHDDEEITPIRHWCSDTVRATLRRMQSRLRYTVRHEGTSQIKQLLGLRGASEIGVGFAALLPG
ncbi:TnpA family transposase [Xanthomonas arboricola]